MNMAYPEKFQKPEVPFNAPNKTEDSAFVMSNTDRSRSSVFQMRQPLRNKTPNLGKLQGNRGLGGRSKASMSKINNNTFVFMAS